MGSIHLDQKQGLIRIYKEGLSYENHDPYETILSFMYLSTNTVYVYGLRGRATPEYFKLVLNAFRGAGMGYVLFEKSKHFDIKGSEPLLGGLYYIIL